MDDFRERLKVLLRSYIPAFPGFDFLNPAGVLCVPIPQEKVDRIRVEVPPQQFLHLQSIGLRARDEATDVTNMVTGATLSGWHQEWAPHGNTRFDPAALLRFDSPSGIAFHTDRSDQASWIELALAEPVALADILLRNVDTRFAGRAAGIRVSSAEPGSELVSRYDAALESVKLERFLRAQVDPETEPTLASLIPTIVHSISGNYGKARRGFKKAKAGLSADDMRAFRNVISEELLQSRFLEWTVHGPQRSFRFWTLEEKRQYIKFAADVTEDLRGLTPNVALGFGAALAAVRDGDLIPHDDDLDLIVGFEPHEAETLPQALDRVETFLRQRGYVVVGDFFAHRHVHKPGSKKVDVFVGLFEGDKVSWFPGKRGALDRRTMFPTGRGEILGIAVPLPAQPHRYLEIIYGSDWKTPDPGFSHTWSRRGFADQRTVSVESTPKVPDSRSHDASDELGAAGIRFRLSKLLRARSKR